MSEALNHWLQAWGEWLDALLATGLACPARETRQRMQRWCEDAELLGFARQAGAVRRLLEEGADMEQRARLLFDLLSEHDILRRSYQLLELQALAESDAAEDEPSW